MIDLLYKKNIQILIILIHVAVGFVSASSASLNGLFYIGIFAYFLFDVVYTGDRGSRAGFYALYIMGFEIVYRTSGMAFFSEMGKYMSIMLLLAGLFAGKRKFIPIVFIFVLFLFIPSIFLTKSDSLSWTRKLVMFNISGPLSLVFSGLYFYRRVSLKTDFDKGIRLAYYPAISLLVVLTLKSSLSSVSFQGLDSSYAMSGGFAPNQVSTGIGLFLMFGMIELIRNNRLLVFFSLDIVVLVYLLIRGLLTMSRGGIFGAVIAVVAALFYGYLFDVRLRKLLKKLFLPGVVVMLILFAGIWYANMISGNYILYRYEGKTLNEVKYGEASNRDYFTGRGKIIEGDIAAFKEYPILGVGYGMSAHWHSLYLGKDAVAHTEYARLLSENGSLGIIVLLLCFIVLPIKHTYLMVVNGKNQLYFVAFLMYSYLTMFHAAMRLAIPGVLYGASFMIIAQYKKK